MYAHEGTVTYGSFANMIRSIDQIGHLRKFLETNSPWKGSTTKYTEISNTSHASISCYNLNLMWALVPVSGSVLKINQTQVKNGSCGYQRSMQYSCLMMAKSFTILYSPRMEVLTSLVRAIIKQYQEWVHIIPDQWSLTCVHLIFQVYHWCRDQLLTRMVQVFRVMLLMLATQMVQSDV